MDKQLQTRPTKMFGIDKKLPTTRQKVLGILGEATITPSWPTHIWLSFDQAELDATQ